MTKGLPHGWSMLKNNKGFDKFGRAELIKTRKNNSGLRITGFACNSQTLKQFFKNRTD